MKLLVHGGMNFASETLKTKHELEGRSHGRTIST